MITVSRGLFRIQDVVETQRGKTKGEKRQDGFTACVDRRGSGEGLERGIERETVVSFLPP